MPQSPRRKTDCPSRLIYRRLASAIWIAGAMLGSANAFELTSPDMKQGDTMPDRFLFNGMGCKGENQSPSLSWSDPPAGTKSFAIMVHDPDAPTGGAGIWHWVVINIPPGTTSLEAGASTPDGSKLPPGSRQIANDYIGLTGNPAWGGPCPPKGAQAHIYNFTVYALKVERLDPPPSATASQVGFFINMNALGRARLSIKYGRD